MGRPLRLRAVLEEKKNNKLPILYGPPSKKKATPGRKIKPLIRCPDSLLTAVENNTLRCLKMSEKALKNALQCLKSLKIVLPSKIIARWELLRNKSSKAKPSNDWVSDSILPDGLPPHLERGEALQLGVLRRELRPRDELQRREALHHRPEVRQLLQPPVRLHLSQQRQLPVGVDVHHRALGARAVARKACHRKGTGRGGV